MALAEEHVARAVAEAVLSVAPELLCVTLAGPGGALMTRVCREIGVTVVHEAFPDRAYTPDGTLVSRRFPGAVITGPNQVADRALMMAQEQKVVAIDGTIVPCEARTLCVHGDNPGAVEMLKSIKGLLEREGISVRPMGAAGVGQAFQPAAMTD